MPGGNPMNTNEGAGLTLLVIDDEYQNLELIESVLQQPGLDILTTTSPERGVALFRERRPEIVLLDLMMPNVCGMDLLEQIVAIDPRTEVILMTGYYAAESAVEAIHKGAADYLTKPLNIAALQSRISKLIEENRRRLYITQL